MYWLVTIYFDEDDYVNYSVHAYSEEEAIDKAVTYMVREDSSVTSDMVGAVEFNTYEHGDPADYELIT